MSKRLSPKVAQSLSEFCEQSPVDRVCEMACIIFLHKKREFSRNYYSAASCNKKWFKNLPDGRQARFNDSLRRTTSR